MIRIYTLYFLVKTKVNHSVSRWLSTGFIRGNCLSGSSTPTVILSIVSFCDFSCIMWSSGNVKFSTLLIPGIFGTIAKKRIDEIQNGNVKTGIEFWKEFNK